MIWGLVVSFGMMAMLGGLALVVQFAPGINPLTEPAERIIIMLVAGLAVMLISE